jgi:hypothetical protein
MSRDEVRRPLRYLCEAGLAPAPVQRVDAVALARSGERFQRTLGAAPSRRTQGSTPQDGGRSAAPVEAKGTPAPASKAPPAAPAAARPPAQAARAAPAVAGPATVDETGGDEAPVPPAGERPDLGWWKAPPAAASPDAWPDQIAHAIADVCQRADPAFLSCTVTVPVDPEVLADTELRLSLSPHWLSLRFATRSPDASRLLFIHRPRLQSLLERMPNLPHGIDIEIA